MSAPVEQETAPVTGKARRINLRRSARGAMSGGGTVTHEVFVDDRWVGWVGDERAWMGHRHGGRRWWASWREAGDTVARWSEGGYRTRAAALDALLDELGDGAR